MTIARWILRIGLVAMRCQAVIKLLIFYIIHVAISFKRLTKPRYSINSAHVLTAVQDNANLVLDDFDHILESILLHKTLFDTSKIPIKFEVPAESPW